MPDEIDSTVHELVALLTPAIGEESAREAVMRAAKSLGPAGRDVVLDALAKYPGVVGAAARLAQTRRGKPETESQRAAARTGTSTRLAAARPQRTVDVEQLAELLAPSLGQEKSLEVLTGALDRLGAPRTGIDMSQALQVLEGLATEPGLVGVASRFAKARLILLFTR
jgi:hypothetical protein